MKIIIVKKEDGGIIIINYHSGKFGPERKIVKDNLGNKIVLKQFEELPALKKYIDQGLEWFLIDREDLPKKSTLESRKQLYHDGNSVKVDLTWENRLMPDQLIKRKNLKKLQAKIAQELEKENPDVIKILKFNNEYSYHSIINSGPHNENLYWSELALKKLNEKVSIGEPDKPIIREKLLAKINELKQEKGE